MTSLNLPLYNHSNGTLMIIVFILVCLILSYAVISIVSKGKKS